LRFEGRDKRRMWRWMFGRKKGGGGGRGGDGSSVVGAYCVCFRFDGSGRWRFKSMYIGGCLMFVWDCVIQGTVAFTTGYSYDTVQRYPGKKG